MIGNNLLCQLGAVISNFYDVVIARVACSVPDDHPKTLGLASCGIVYAFNFSKKKDEGYYHGHEIGVGYIDSHLTELKDMI